MLAAYHEQVTMHQASNTHLIQAMRTIPATWGKPAKLVTQEKFDSSVDHCRGFLQQCDIFFALQAEVYHKDSTKCFLSFLMPRLMGWALDWTTVVWNTDTQVHSSITYFPKPSEDVTPHTFHFSFYICKKVLTLLLNMLLNSGHKPFRVAGMTPHYLPFRSNGNCHIANRTISCEGVSTFHYTTLSF